MLHVKHWNQQTKEKTAPVIRARKCNLCGTRFQARSPHRCFCDDCRASDIYKFHDWLPEAPQELWEQEEAPAAPPGLAA